jgi:uncharacterized membrane protein YebE (DUF533 family)
MEELMSLGETLIKVAIGVVIAKGVTSLTQGGTASAQTGGAGRGTPFDPKPAGQSTGLEDIMKDVIGSGSRARTGTQRQGTTKQGGTGGSLDALLEELSGQKRASPRATAPKGGLDELLGQLTGTGGMSGGVTGASAGRAAAPGGIGDLLEQMLGGRQPGAPVELPEPKREEALSAALMLRAVIQAVKCDGALDEAEKAKLMRAMGEASPREVQAINAELQRPVDVQGLARAVPPGLEPQIYLVSLTAINLDQRAEADYLHQLAGALDLSPDQVNAIHDKVRAPRLYR